MSHPAQMKGKDAKALRYFTVYCYNLEVKWKVPTRLNKINEGPQGQNIK